MIDSNKEQVDFLIARIEALTVKYLELNKENKYLKEENSNLIRQVEDYRWEEQHKMSNADGN